MNLFTQNSTHYHLLKYLLIFLKNTHVYLIYSYSILLTFLSKFTSHKSAYLCLITDLFSLILFLHNIFPGYCHLNFGLPDGRFPFRFNYKTFYMVLPYLILNKWPYISFYRFSLCQPMCLFTLFFLFRISSF
jgi:hypothetical protein